MPDSKLTFEASRLPSADQVVDRLPSVFRLQSIARFPFDERHTLCQAALFHEQASLKVEWLCRHPDSRLTLGSLIAIRLQGRPTSTAGAIQIFRLVKLERLQR